MHKMETEREDDFVKTWWFLCGLVVGIEFIYSSTIANLPTDWIIELTTDFDGNIYILASRLAPSIRMASELCETIFRHFLPFCF